MKEALVSEGPVVKIHDAPIPKPNQDQVLIKVLVSGSNPKDWKYRDPPDEPQNTGDDIAGVIEAVGENVVEFKPGDRVAAFHEMMKPAGSFAEYAIAWSHSTFHLPKNVTFEEGATVPLAAMTSAIALYIELGLPNVWEPATSKIPLIIYGASSAIGAFAIKLAQLSNIHPLICVAGRAQEFVESLIDRSKGDTIVDYRQGDDAVTAGIKAALSAAGFTEAKHAFDGISEKNSYQNIAPALAQSGSKLTHVLPLTNDSDLPQYIQRSKTYVGAVHQELTEEQVAAGIKTSTKDFAHAYFRLFSRGLQEGWLTGHPYEVVPGGLNGIQKALNDLRDGKNSGLKYVFRIEDTN